MSGIYDWYKWISEHSEDKRDLTPQPPTHPVPSYVAEADKAEHEAWQAYARASYERLLQRKIKNLGKQGAAEVAVKVAEFLSSKVRATENV